MGIYATQNIQDILYPYNEEADLINCTSISLSWTNNAVSGDSFKLINKRSKKEMIFEYDVILNLPSFGIDENTFLLDDWTIDTTGLNNPKSLVLSVQGCEYKPNV